jgi:hypothetical protein
MTARQKNIPIPQAASFRGQIQSFRTSVAGGSPPASLNASSASIEPDVQSLPAGSELVATSGNAMRW